MRKYFGFDSFLTGTLVGVFLPQLIIVCYWLFAHSYMGFPGQFYSRYLVAGKILSPVLSLCVLPNLGIFFLYINSENYKSGRGIIFATILYGLFILISKIWIEQTFSWD